MGCVSSKILTKSGSFQEKVNHSFQRSNLIEEIILSNSKSNGDQFLALLCTSNSAARRTNDAEQSPAAAAESAKIETIDVSELLAGLEEENTAEEEEQEHQDGQKDQDGKSSSQCASDGAAGRAKSFRTVEEFDALVTQSSSSELASPEQDVSLMRRSSSEQEEARTAIICDQDAMVTQSNASEREEVAGAKRRARARQLGELKVPAAFDFSKSDSLREWLLRGGQIFSPGSYVTPKFGNAAAASEHGGRQASEQHQHAVFDPELVAQFEQAMEQLSVDEERVLKEILEAMEAGEKVETERLERLNDQSEPVVVQN